MGSSSIGRVLYTCIIPDPRFFINFSNYVEFCCRKQHITFQNTLPSSKTANWAAKLCPATSSDEASKKIIIHSAAQHKSFIGLIQFHYWDLSIMYLKYQMGFARFIEQIT